MHSLIAGNLVQRGPVGLETAVGCCWLVVLAAIRLFMVDMSISVVDLNLSNDTDYHSIGDEEKNIGAFVVELNRHLHNATVDAVVYQYFVDDSDFGFRGRTRLGGQTPPFFPPVEGVE